MFVLRFSGRFAPAALALVPIIATAHHSFAATFDVEVVNELEGEVTSVQWRNPHVLYTLRSTDEQGLVTVHDVESHSLSLKRRMEVSADALSVGDFVRVAGHPNRRTALGREYWNDRYFAGDRR
jgi:hypothetical protein